MKKLIVLIFVIVSLLHGCDGSSSYSSSNYYTGLSKHVKKTTGTSNLIHGYKEIPVLDTNDPQAEIIFEKIVEDYLKGVDNDLKEVKDKEDNATEKINAVANAVNIGLENFSFGFFPVGSVSKQVFKRESNFDILGYPEFPDFHYPIFFPVKPSKPMFLDNELAVDVYNRNVREYKRDVADLAATIKDYIEDAEHYVENCENDYEEIKDKGKPLQGNQGQRPINGW